MLKRLWLILGPVFCALLQVSLILFIYPITYHYDRINEKKMAVTLTAGSFKSKTEKMTALTDKNSHFVPFFGSSEWLRFDSMHPAVLAEKYHRSYQPYFLGERGTASLNQFFGMQQILPEIQNQSVVYVVSPQWFTKKGYDASAFQQYFNSGQLISFLTNQEGDSAAQYAAKRVLVLNPSVTMKETLEKVSNNQALTKSDNDKIQFRAEITQREDHFFSDFVVGASSNYDKLVASKLSHLPQKFSYASLEKIAIKEAKSQTKSNNFGINDIFYHKKIAYRFDKLKGSQKKFSYLKSPEYNDLQLVLNQFDKSHTNAIFIIPPVNVKWAEYTNLDMNKYQAAVDKIKYQLMSQGFTNIADFSKEGATPYFMEDTIHLGWLGWLAFDKAVDPFLSHPTPAPTYHINSNFLTKEWANYDGKVDQFKN